MIAAKLTHRQRQVLQMLHDGLTRVEITEKIGLHRTTVDDHIYNARTSLEARTTVHAVVIAKQEGVIG